MPPKKKKAPAKVDDESQAKKARTDADQEPDGAAAAATDAATDAGTDAAAASAGPRGAGGAAKAFADVSLEGKTFVVTGDFDRGRFGVEAIITKLGGKVVQSITKSTSFLLLGRKGEGQFGTKTGPGTQKHKDAKKKKIPIVDEAWLVEQDTQEEPIDIAGLWDRIVAAKEAIKAANPGGVAKEVPEGATETELEAAEERLGYKLPAELKKFYRITNGGGEFTKAENLRNDGNDYGPLKRFYRLMKMVCISEYVHVASNGIVFEWDVSFDGQCGNSIVADNFGALLKTWAENLEAEAKQEKPSLGYGQRWRRADEPDLDKSAPHASFFKSFKSSYESCFGRWPQYMS